MKKEIKNKAKWNGEECSAEAGSVVIGKSESPSWWCYLLAGMRRKTIRVNYNGHIFFIDNQDGSGARKVFKQGGGMNSYHASIPVDDESTFVKDDE